jgi:hypothetical protein
MSNLGAAIAGLGIVFFLFSLVIAIFFVYVWWRIFSKAGYSGAMSLLLLVPIANLVVILILSFGEWPIYRELNQLRQTARPGSGQYPPQYAQQYPQPQQFTPPPQFPSSPQYPAPQYPQQPQQPRYPQG